MIHPSVPAEFPLLSKYLHICSITSVPSAWMGQMRWWMWCPVIWQNCPPPPSLPPSLRAPFPIPVMLYDISSPLAVATWWYLLVAPTILSPSPPNAPSLRAPTPIPVMLYDMSSALAVATWQCPLGRLTESVGTAEPYAWQVCRVQQRGRPTHLSRSLGGALA